MVRRGADVACMRSMSTGGGDGPVLVDYWKDQKALPIVTINRPDQLNALDMNTLTALANAIKAVRTSPETRAIILTGRGRAFCAGIDLKTAMQIFQGKENVIGSDRDPVYQMQETKVPIIGAIHGFAITGGFELALNCDFLYGTPETKFMDTHCKFGIHPSWGLSMLLSRIVGPMRAREVSLTSKPIDATTAKEWGLLNRIVSEEELLPTAGAAAEAISQNVPDMVGRFRCLINQSQSLGTDEGLQEERDLAAVYYRRMTPEMFEQMGQFIKARSKGK
eukprot:CAMPEP_0174292148 /NCGR_PEP_ID=MMETSP0809-20121228/34452_1 /TAXON_ID=73025 ORGANISM="Eutreptiella gymnastica-like, Strain CCMP1594" /NCGR_SAMPLE_ID=MMETSP0809 /ASSEMBLY_ACC=CAM_ASM_000658 /LENGTH=277 /DNA_ID=CAMNT_0015392011 /DNA_START=71 /DNA_END=904 /DNA_ORIENTATION=+